MSAGKKLPGSSTESIWSSIREETAADRVISADSHIQEPPELYGEWLDKEFRERAPRVEERDGQRYFIVDGKKPRRMDLAEERTDEDDQNREFRDDPTGGRDIERRLSDQKRDGVNAEVIYPNSSLFLYNSRDPGYQFAVARAYNDWIIELFGPHPEHFAPVAIIPVIDIDRAVKEVERVAAQGFRTIKVPLTVENLPTTCRTTKSYGRPSRRLVWS